MTRRLVFRACLSILAMSRLRLAAAAGNSRVTQEYAVKAAFLFYLAQFVTWPDPISRGAGPLVFGVFGVDPFGATLDQTLAKQTVSGHALEVQRINKLADVSKCQVLFVSASEEARLPLVWEALRDSSTLTVSDLPGFITRGGMVGFVEQSSKVRFAINLKAMISARLKASSQLLGLAVEVEK